MSEGNTIQFDAQLVTETVYLGNRLARVVLRGVDNLAALRRINDTPEGRRVRVTIEYLEDDEWPT